MVQVNHSLHHLQLKGQFLHWTYSTLSLCVCNHNVPEKKKRRRRNIPFLTRLLACLLCFTHKNLGYCTFPHKLHGPDWSGENKTGFMWNVQHAETRVRDSYLDAWLRTVAPLWWRTYQGQHRSHSRSRQARKQTWKSTKLQWQIHFFSEVLKASTIDCSFKITFTLWEGDCSPELSHKQNQAQIGVKSDSFAEEEIPHGSKYI